jgi:hypothetical protein
VKESWAGQGWICWADEFGFTYVGTGVTPLQALQDWKERVHADFQALYAKRPFEMTAEEVERWASLNGIVDVLEYRQTTPLQVREIGCVHWDRRPFPSSIAWIHGRLDRISLEDSPSDLAGYRPGQWVDAIVERDPLTSRLLRITHVQRIPTIRPESESGIEKAWDRMATAKLPDSDADWSD